MIGDKSASGRFPRHLATPIAKRHFCIPFPARDRVATIVITVRSTFYRRIGKRRNYSFPICIRDRQAVFLSFNCDRMSSCCYARIRIIQIRGNEASPLPPSLFSSSQPRFNCCLDLNPFGMIAASLPAMNSKGFLSRCRTPCVCHRPRSRAYL